MNLPYVLRLFFLSFAIFFIVHAVAALAIRLATPAIIKLSREFRARSAARFLLAARFLPAALAVLVVFGLCVPSYLWFEPGATTEQISFGCALAAFVGAILWTSSFFRTIRAIVATRKFTRTLRDKGHERYFAADIFPALIVEGDAPILAMTGVFRPRLVISQSLLRSLSPRQLEAAVLHERAHRKSADNLKRLLLLLSPEILPFVPWSNALDHAWRTVSEWAADDFAVDGNSQRSLSLAAALIRVAQMGASPRMSPLCTALVSVGGVSADSDLADRVNRLLRPAPFRDSSTKRKAAFTGSAVATLALFIALFAIRPATLQSVHQVLERLIH